LPKGNSFQLELNSVQSNVTHLISVKIKKTQPYPDNLGLGCIVCIYLLHKAVMQKQPK